MDDALSEDESANRLNEAEAVFAANSVEDFRHLPHPRALAFLGDTVFELFLREEAVAKGYNHSKDLHQYTSTWAKASAQVGLLHQLKPQLTTAERDLVRQGRNIGVGSNRRAGQADHRLASGLEALLGALYLRNPARLKILLDACRALLKQAPFNPLLDNIPENLPDTSSETNES